MKSKTIEFKLEYTEDIKYAVVAFANTDGGKIILVLMLMDIAVVFLSLIR